MSEQEIREGFEAWMKREIHGQNFPCDLNDFATSCRHEGWQAACTWMEGEHAKEREELVEGLKIAMSMIPPTPPSELTGEVELFWQNTTKIKALLRRIEEGS